MSHKYDSWWIHTHDGSNTFGRIGTAFRIDINSRAGTLNRDYNDDPLYWLEHSNMIWNKKCASKEQFYIWFDWWTLNVLSVFKISKISYEWGHARRTSMEFILTSRKVLTVVPFVPIIAPACEDWTKIRSSVSPSFRRIPDFMISSFKISAIFFINKSNFSRLKIQNYHVIKKKIG